MVSMLRQIRKGKGDPQFPLSLTRTLGVDAPGSILAVGNMGLLTLSAPAVFCSARCPGDLILAAYDLAARWREESVPVIGPRHRRVPHTRRA
jgi:hypothetical protein